VPLIVLFVPAALALIPESRDPHPGPFDPASVALSLVAMVPLVFAVKHGASAGLDDTTLAALALGLSAGWWFIRRQQRSATPMLDLTLFRNPVFSGALAANALSLMALAGFLYFGAQLLQLVLGLSPLESALVLVPGSVATMVAGFAAVRLVERIPARTLVPLSFLLSSVGYALAAFTGQPTVVSVGVAFTILGVGIGLAETITNDLILSSVPPQKAGAASAISETAYEIGAVLGTAVLGSVLTATFRSNLTVPSAARYGEQENAFETLGSTMEFAEQFAAPVQGWIQESAAAAFDLGVQFTAGAAIFVALAAALVSRRALKRA